jgi:hypothetical protein
MTIKQEKEVMIQLYKEAFLSSFTIPNFTLLQCCGSGSGIHCLFDPLDPGWVISQDPDPRYRSGIRNEQPRSYFIELGSHFFLA